MRPARRQILETQRNVVFVGGTGTGKSHLSIAITANCIRKRNARARFFNVVDLVNRLEAEARAGVAGRLAEQLTRVDLVALDELGYLPFAQSGGQLLFHLGSGHESALYDPFARTNGELMRPELNSHFARV